MSKFDNYGILKSRGTSIPHEDDIPRFDRGTRDHTSLPPPPPIILPNPQFQSLEKFQVTQALLAMKHQDGRSVCTYVFKIKSHIDWLRVLGVVVSRKLAIDWVLQSLLESHTEFIKDYDAADHDMTLIYLTYLLVAFESAMIWHTGKANLIGRSTSQTYMDIDNGNIGRPEKYSLPNGNGSAKVKLFDHMVRERQVLR